MKNIIYFSVLMLALVLVSTSCKKEDVATDTFEQKYPEWKNLTSVVGMEINIVDNLITVKYPNHNPLQYRDMDIEWNYTDETYATRSTTEGEIIFYQGVYPADRDNFYFLINRTAKTITISGGQYYGGYTYVLTIN